MIFVNFTVRGDLIESVNLRSFGLKPRPNPKTQMIYKLIWAKKRQTNKERESQKKKEQEEKHREEMRREEERRNIFKAYLARRVAGSFLNDFTYTGRF
jgi:hypothetical protein